MPWLHSLKDAGGSHASADAHADEAVSSVPPPHLIKDSRCQSRTGASKRMPEGNRTAVDVQFFRVDQQLFETGEYLRRKCLVELDEIHLIERQARELQHLPDGRHRSETESL